MNEEMTTAEVLRAAADKLIRDGHVKEKWGDATSPNCVLGAIAHVDEGGLDYLKAKGALRAHLKGLGVPNNRDLDDVIAWNNAPERTADEVITTLLACAADLESKAVTP